MGPFIFKGFCMVFVWCGKFFIVFVVVIGSFFVHGCAMLPDHFMVNGSCFSLGSYQDKTVDNLFIKIAKANDKKAMQRFLDDAYIDVSTGQSSYQRSASLSTTPLILACILEDEQVALSMVQFFLDCDADVNVQDRQKYHTPLYLAVQQGYSMVSQLLIKHGAHRLMAAAHGATILHAAASSHVYDEAIHLFCLQQKVFIDAVDNSGQTPLMLAIITKNIQSALFLLAHGANPSAQGGSLGTPLHYAVYAKNIDMINTLLACGADCTIADGEIIRQTPLELAQELGFGEIANILKSFVKD